MSFDPGSRISVFGALRPDPGQTVSRAVVATYSLDLVALLGLVLALGGDTEAEFENSPLGLVKIAAGQLAHSDYQVGRIIAPRAHRSILPLLDTMVEAIRANERRQSWHPKVALVRYEGDPVEWRFWIGSRNLTGSRDLDAGLLLVSRQGGASGVGHRRTGAGPPRRGRVHSSRARRAAHCALADSRRHGCPVPAVA